MKNNLIIKTLLPIVQPKIEPLHDKGVSLLDNIPLEENEFKAVIQISTKEGELYAFIFAINEKYEAVRQIEINNKKSWKLKDLLTNILTQL